MSTKQAQTDPPTTKPRRKNKPPSTNDKVLWCPHPPDDAELAKTWWDENTTSIDCDTGPDGQLRPTAEQVRSIEATGPPGFTYMPSWSDPDKYDETVQKHLVGLCTIIVAVGAMMDALRAHARRDTLSTIFGPPELPGVANVKRALLAQAFTALKKAAKDGWEGATLIYDGEDAGIHIRRWGESHWPPEVCEGSLLLRSVVTDMRSTKAGCADQWIRSLGRVIDLLGKVVSQATKENQTRRGPENNPPKALAGSKPNEEESVGDDPHPTDDRPRRHGAGFRAVVWDGETYHFSVSQAAVVEYLWEQMDNGTHEVSQGTILDKVGSTMAENKHPRLRDLFKRNPAWGTMIVDGKSKGSFRLAEPPPI